MKGKFHALYIGIFLLVGILSIVILVVNGISYYTLPIEERFFSSLHLSLKPSGAIGHGLGIIGTIMMIIGVASYMIRKRVRRMFDLGYLKYWLEFHIFMCTVGPILVLFHTAFKFGGIVAVSFWSMVIVVLSGVVGRFIYVQIPRTIQGKEIDINELNETESILTEQLLFEYNLNKEIIDSISNSTKPIKYVNMSLSMSMFTVLKEIFTFNSFLTHLKSELKKQGITDHNKRHKIIHITKQKMILSRRIGMLRTMQKLFRYWHIFHLPFAFSMFIIMLIHVGVTIAFGYRWLF
ncbi:MAG: hypothetical protein AB1521_06945 [Bacteroidota bacterium]